MEKCTLRTQKTEPLTSSEEKDLKTVTHNGVTIQFDPIKHKYIDTNGVEYQGVTTFISTLFPEFEALRIATKCSKNPKKKEYFGRKPEEIVLEWEKNAKEAAAFGTLIHAQAEKMVWGELVDIITNATKTPTKKQKYVHAVYEFIQILLEKYEVVSTEQILFSPKYGLAGTVDLLLKDKETGEYVIADWKTSKKITKANFFQKGFAPLKHLDDCNQNHFFLQLNIYQALLEEETYYPFFDYKKKVFHITEKGVKEIDVPDMPKEMELILKEAE